ncbi:MAG: YciI family protein [Micromonosporaceae bacterium]
MAFFAVTMVHGPNWDASRPIREQQAWDEHAVFMDGLVDDGAVVLGGPLGDGERALLIVEATDEREIQACMAQDPWASMGLLHISAIEPWTIWLDGRQRDGGVRPVRRGGQNGAYGQTDG